jgi:hypothetical protein
MGVIRRALGLQSPAAFTTRLPSRYVWRVASHKLFGVAGLDPCGNVLLRWREGSTGTGGWVRAQLQEEARTFPLHWEAALRITTAAATGKAPAAVTAAAAPAAAADGSEPSMAAATSTTASATTAATAAPSVRTFLDASSGVLRILPSDTAAPVKLRDCRRSRWVTFAYKGTYYATWAAACFGALCAYWWVKQEVVSYWGRQQLTRIEEAVLHGIEDTLLFLRHEAITRGMPESVVLKLDVFFAALKGFGEWLVVKAGYDAVVHDFDQALVAAEQRAESRAEALVHGATAYWNLVGYFALFLCCIVFFL